MKKLEKKANISLFLLLNKCLEHKTAKSVIINKAIYDTIHKRGEYMNHLEEINLQIEEIKSKQDELLILRRRSDSIITEIYQVKRDLLKAKNSYYKEKKDVEKLEKLSLKSLLTSIMGTKREQLTKEQKEMVDAKTILDNFKEQLDDLESEKNELSSQISNISSDQDLLQKLTKEKRKIILSINPNLAEEIAQLEHEARTKNSIINELIDVIRQCERTISSIDTALSNVRSAHNWGKVDMFLNGGIITHIQKHDKIKQSNQYINIVRSNLRILKKELGDVDAQRMALQNIDTTDIVFDIFFDNMFTDWNVQSKLNKAIANLQSVRNSVISIKSKIHTKMSDAKEIISKNNLEIKKIIQNY